MYKHNLGRLSRQFDTLEEAAQNVNTMFTKDVWVVLANREPYLSSSFREIKPIIGNRLCKNKQCEVFYLVINSQGKILNKIRL